MQPVGNRAHKLDLGRRLSEQFERPFQWSIEVFEWLWVVAKGLYLADQLYCGQKLVIWARWSVKNDAPI